MSSLSKLNAKKHAARKAEKPSQPKSQIQAGKPTTDACPDFLRNVTKLTNDRPHASKTHSGWCESLMAALLGEKDFAEDASVFISTKWPKIPKPVLGQDTHIELLDVESDDEDENNDDGEVVGDGNAAIVGDGAGAANIAAAATIAAAKLASDTRILERRLLKYDDKVEARGKSRKVMFQLVLTHTITEKAVNHLKSKIGPEQWLHFSLVERSLPKLLRLAEQEFNDTGNDKSLKARRMIEFNKVRQQKGETLDSYYARFCKSLKDAHDVDATIGDESEQIYFFMHRVNHESAYKRAVEELDIAVNRNEKNYPISLDGAYSWLEQVPIKAQFAPVRHDVGEQLAFLSQRVESLAKGNKQQKKQAAARATADEESDTEVITQEWWKEADCFECGEKGHIKAHCPKRKDASKGKGEKKKSEKKKAAKKKTAVTAAFTLAETDSESDNNERASFFATCTKDAPHQRTPGASRVMSAALEKGAQSMSRDVVCDGGSETNLIGGGGKYLLKNIRPMKKALTITGVTDGRRVVKLCGDLVNGLGTVPFDPQSPVNIIALSKCDDSPLLSMRYEQRSSAVPISRFVLETPTNTYEFPRKRGLFVCPGHLFAQEHRADAVEALMATTAEREKLYTKREVEAARKAERLAERLMFPSKKELARIIPTITNAPVTVHDVVRANHISPTMTIARAKGMTVRKKPPVVKVETLDLFPMLQRDLTMEVDIFFVGKQGFLLSLTRPLGLVMVEPLDGGRGTKHLQKSLMAMVGAYRARGFTIKTIQTDNEGGIVWDAEFFHSEGITIDAASPNAHVGGIERKVKQVRERSRAVINTLPYQLPLFLIVKLVQDTVSRMNLSPNPLGQLNISPREAFLGIKTDYDRDLRVGFGDVVQFLIHEETSNSLKERTATGICVLHKSNLSRSIVIYRPRVGQRGTFCTRGEFKVLDVIPDSFIDHMNMLCKQRGELDVPASLDPVFRLGLRKKIVQPIEEDDGEDLPQANVHQPEPVNVDQVPDADNEVVEPQGGGVENPQAGEAPGNLESDQNLDAFAQPPMEPEQSTSEPQQPQSEPAQSTEEGDTAESEAPIELEEPVVRRNPPRAGRTDYKSRVYTATVEKIFHVKWARDKRMLNITVDKALDLYGEAALSSIIEELTKLPNMDVILPVDWRKLSAAEMRKVIRSKMFLKAKFLPDGAFDKLKARLVAGGHMQNRADYDDVSSPTIATQSAFMLAAIAAKEGRHVVVVDIASAYLNAKMDPGRKVRMRLEPKLADILCTIDPKYKNFLMKDGSLIVHLTKALYGLLESAKLWYEDLKTTLESNGMVANPYDPCVFNKTVDGVQLTTGFHVDDLFISSTSMQLINELLDVLKKRYKTITEHHGELQNYLGMQFDFSVPGKVTIRMTKYVEDILNNYGVRGTAKTPATVELFTIDLVSPRLRKSVGESFHSAVATLLYLAKKIRGDLLPAVSFLTTRVTCSTEEDQVKLDRVLKYLNGTKGQSLTLEVGDKMEVIAYVDASYGVHPDAKGHTGAVITLGKGAVSVKSAKQKLVAKSSTESELIALSDEFSPVLWTRNFLGRDGQGYKMGPAKVYEDNMSAISLAEKGRSTSGRTRHIDIRYFFIKDRIDSGEIEIEHLGTSEMIADMLTKPLQGELFRRMRAKLLNAV